MIPIDFPQANVVGKPVAGCPLPVPTYLDPSGATVWCFQPAEVEQAAIACGSPVWLTTQIRNGMVWVTLSTVSPWVPADK